MNSTESKILDKIRYTKTRVTIITPTYNRADYIMDTMQSILDQNYKDYKYIIIDDGSTDGTEKIVRDFIKGKNNWFYLRQDNVGEPATVNRGWGLCNSEYFIQVNSDDLVSPTLLDDMVKVLDDNPECILAYPDFYIINNRGKIIDNEKNSDFDLLKDLSMFSCYPACPGAFIRKSALSGWNEIRNLKYRFISDIDMLWRMALCGEFIHVPKFLASWRSHEGGISTDRYKSIPEIDTWANEFFSQNDLPKKVKGIEAECRRSIYNHYARLMDKSGLDCGVGMANYYREKANISMPRYINLQVGDNDLMGNKFNGHDLHINLRKRNIESNHLVLNKQSDDKDTYIIAAERHNRENIRQYTALIQSSYDLDCINNPLMVDIMYNKLFLEADVVHFHLMHNGILDLQLIPMMSRLKPIVWTLHDTWSVFGDEDYLSSDYAFPSGIKNLRLNFELRKDAIRNSDITFVTASKSLKSIMEKSSMFIGKKIFHVPFGLDLNVFYPRNKKDVRAELGIGPSEKVVILRGNIRNTKGLDYIEYVMNNIGSKYDIRFLVVAGNDLVDVPEHLKVNYYGWMNDDELMAKLYSAADLLLMPSKREGFGMMAIEAMACGTMPIVLNGTALPDTVNSPHCGLSTAKNMQDYCNAVEHFIVDDEDRINRSEKCVKYIKKNHTIDKYIDALEDVYSYAMSHHRCDDNCKKLLSDLKMISETGPSIKLCSNNAISSKADGVISVARLSRLNARLKISLKSDGVSITTRKIASKIKTKISNRLRNI